MTGPLAGLRVLEFAGLGPTPFAGMMLADQGADVLRIERRDATGHLAGDPRLDTLNRGRGSICLDLKTEEGRDFAAMLSERCDILLEGYRPGVMERLGLGPDRLCAANERLIYARMTGWGQQGPIAGQAGHDINYMALTGALHAMGPAGAPPVPPLNLVADFGGGGMLVVNGILAALVERSRSGRGQVVDAAMVDGVALLMAQIASWQAMGFWRDERGTNVLDGSAYFYRCYETADGGHVAVGALEKPFHDILIEGLGLDPAEFTDHLSPGRWVERSERLERIFRTRSRDEWVAHFDGKDACLSPVLTIAEAPLHPANRERQLMAGLGAGWSPAAAPRLSRTPAAPGTPPLPPGEGGQAAIQRWGVPEAMAGELADRGVLDAR
ncbi:CaiB/BaiF CoA-transferase family protein [Sphingomonas sp. LHG3406-1]|uniref:CaiB/BaiF CoA transferase family protein n=1 Tax=Sphingomonas sp. LHG3406-1 TaxID=2804617 RepID=UPI0026219425|nr:CaiB/BaiF CoA-transferase family protein [Sphingomonas sp. LHG3406-1]